MTIHLRQVQASDTPFLEGDAVRECLLAVSRLVQQLWLELAPKQEAPALRRGFCRV